MKRILNLLLCVTLTLSLTAPALAAGNQSEQETAAAWLKEQGIMTGDQNGNLGLASGLTRAELAVILTRLHGEGQVNPNHYTWACYFTDVPGWAKPYVGYCVAHLLVAGYDSSRFGPNDPVTPAMACTVILRTCGYERGEGTDWNYRTACDYAARLGLIDRSAAQAATITRGEMAVLIYRARQEQPDSIQPSSIPQTDSITVAPDGTITGKIITQPAWSREDFSRQANPAIFTGYYTREWYNALRQSIVDRKTIVAGNEEDNFNPKYLYAHTLVPYTSEELFDAFSYVLGRIHGQFYYYLGAESYTKNQYEYSGYTIIKVTNGWLDQKVLDFLRPELERINGMSNRSKAIELNTYLCSLMEYDRTKTAVEDEVFSSHPTPVLGQCSSYATAFSFLCDAANVPCILVSSANHSWNEVYVDGSWLVVDVSSNDVSVSKDIYLLTLHAPGIDRCPAGTRFAKELLVPGSTK